MTNDPSSVFAAITYGGGLKAAACAVTGAKWIEQDGLQFGALTVVVV
jgi:hypothetical protein